MLYDEHRALGARMVDFGGWEMPVQYSGILDEHRTVRSAAGLFDVSHMGEIEINGKDAEACCRRIFVNDAAAIRPGQAQYSMMCNAEGGVVDDVIVYRLDTESFLVCVNAANAARDYRWILEHFEGDCVVADRSDDYGLIAVQGPVAVSIVRALLSEAEDLARFSFVLGSIEGIDVLLARTGYTGEDGFECFVAAPRAVELWRLLLAAGSERGLKPVGLGARDTLRLEAALPLYGHELGEDITPFEAGLRWVVKLNRPEMVGYEALEKASRRIARKLVGLVIEGGIARSGYAVATEEGEVGTVTSGSHCPTLGKSLALALVSSDAPGAGLSVNIRGRIRTAQVTGIPFYVRQR